MEISNDVYWLTATIVFTSLMWVPYILNRLKELGVINALMYRDVDPKPVAAWANRMAHAHKNAVENLVLFAPLVILIEITSLNTSATAMAACIYFFTRVAHAVVYALGVPFMRTITFFAGFGCQLYLGITLLGVA